jgi:hypothetical protein
MTDVLELEIRRVGLDVDDVTEVRIRNRGARRITATDGLDMGQRRVLTGVGVDGDTGRRTTCRRP